MLFLNKNIEVLNKLISRVLVVGIWSTSIFYVIGLILLFMGREPQMELNHPLQFQVGNFWSSLFALQAKPFLILGTGALILTPVIRVFLTIILMLKQKDTKFAIVTSLVAFIIIISILVGEIFSLKIG